LEIHETKVGDVVVLMPEGNLTASAECQTLDRKLKQLLDGRTQRIVVDGAKVGQVGSGAIRALLLASHKLVQMSGRLVLCGLSERVRQSFKISGFDNDFAIVSSQDRAVALAQESLPDSGSSAPPKRDQERLRTLVARTLLTSLKKVARPPSAAARSASFESTRDLVLGLLEGEDGRSPGS
jgi:anti-anti-sigma factor